MSENRAAKETLTAYQRWELHPLDGGAKPPARRGTVPLPTAEQLEHIQRQAHDEGFAAGFKKGKAEADAITQRLRALAESLQRETARVDESVASSLLDLALAVARQVAGRALQVRRELLLTLVRDAVATLPPFSEPVHISAHPEDAAFLREQLGAQAEQLGWSLREDAAIARGGLLVRGGGAEVDSTVQMRWGRVVEALGRDCAWLD